jgi:recombinational DNA repair protein (RecF pathway)
MKNVLYQLTQEADYLAADGDPATALFTFFTQTVEQAAQKKAVIDLLAETGVDLQVATQCSFCGRGLKASLPARNEPAPFARTSAPTK